MPNYYAPLNVRFTHTSAVRVQNCKLRIFDRNDISKQASGVTTKVFECRHPHPVESHNPNSGTLAMRGITNYGWTEFDPTSAAETLPSGNADGSQNWVTNEGSAHQGVRHDWYLALSASPDSIGSKTQYGLYFTLE